MYPSVYTLFFTTNSPVEICICTFSFRKVSLVYLPPSFFYTIFSLTLCATVACGGELFFRDVHSKDEKKLHSQKRASVFCPAQVPSFGSLISFLSTTTTTFFPFFLTLVAVVRSFDYAIFAAAAVIIVNSTTSESSRVLCV